MSLTANQPAAAMRARRLRWTAAPAATDDTPAGPGMSFEPPAGPEDSISLGGWRGVCFAACCGRPRARSHAIANSCDLILIVLRRGDRRRA